MKKFLFILIAFSFYSVSAQKETLDSLKHELQKSNHDSVKCEILTLIFDLLEGDDAIKYTKQLEEIADKNIAKKSQPRNTYLRYKGIAISNKGYNYYFQGKIDEAISCFHNSIKIQEETGDSLGIAGTLNNLAAIYDSQGEIKKAIEYFNKSFIILDSLNDKENMAAVINNIATIYDDQGNLPLALENYHKSLKIREEIADESGMAESFSNLGYVTSKIGDYKKALEYNFKSLKIREKLGLKMQVAGSYNNIGSNYEKLNNLTKAVEFYKKSLAIQQQIDHKRGISVSLMNIGTAMSRMNKPDSALFYLKQSLQIAETIDDKSGLALVLGNLGEVYFKSNDISKAQDCGEKALQISRKTGHPQNLNQAASLLSKVYKKQNKFEKALEMHELEIQMRDSINSIENKKATIKSHFKYEYEKKAATDSLKVVEERKIVAVKLKQEKTQRIALISGLVLVLVFSGIMYNRFKITQKQKFIIEAKEKETSLQKHIIEEKHKEITDSINYAERIQRSFLATQQHLDTNLKRSDGASTSSATDSNYFILFKPKDVVSGDFYWSATLNNGHFALATADSTGHGVPGAIMSLLNITSLEKAIETYTEPSEILNATRKIIIERLKKDGSAEGGKDGMDCSLCVYDFNNMKLHVAAAHNPVWIMRGDEVIEIKADKMPVGKHDKQDMPFTLHEMDLLKGDVIYALSDGFPDQFGGPKGKKFMSKQLRELLQSISSKPMNEQKSILEKTFNEWVGNLEQVDDVCVVGIRV